MAMGTNSMTSMDSMTMSSTASAASASASMGMVGMEMGGANACKISMLWNWYTVDACFLSSQWHITSPGMMAGSCIGVIILVIVLEALRRGSKEYDALIARQAAATTPTTTTAARVANDSDSDNKLPNVQTDSTPPFVPRRVMPTLLQQAVRALLHMLQFAVAYFIMLLAMYFNGYIIICILIGAFLGAFIFSWHSFNIPGENRELTYCCA